MITIIHNNIALANPDNQALSNLETTGPQSISARIASFIFGPKTINDGAQDTINDGDRREKALKVQFLCGKQSSSFPRFDKAMQRLQA